MSKFSGLECANVCDGMSISIQYSRRQPTYLAASFALDPLVRYGRDTRYDACDVWVRPRLAHNPPMDPCSEQLNLTDLAGGAPYGKTFTGQQSGYQFASPKLSSNVAAMSGYSRCTFSMF